MKSGKNHEKGSIYRRNLKKTYRLTVLAVGLFLTLGTALSWGQDPSSNDTSDGNSNTGGGFGALVSVTTGTFNTAYGHDALNNNTNGILNTGIGQGALGLNTGGIENTATGAGALANNSTGNNNTASGFQALFSNTTASNNTAVGFNTLVSSTGHDNTGTGTVALEANTTGSKNTAYGSFALQQNTSGFANTALGQAALLTNVTGIQNTAVGLAALQNNSGSNNIAMGFQAGFRLTGGNNNIDIGAFTQGLGGESNTMRIGTGLGLARTLIAGIHGVPVSGSQVFVNANGQLGTAPSSARYKRDIQTMGDRSRLLFQLRPVIFRYKFDPRGERQYGLIAEEVAKVYPELVTKGEDGKVESVQYHKLIPMLLNEVQHQQQTLEAQTQQLAQLKAENTRLEATLAEQNAALAARLARLETATSVGDSGFALKLSSLAKKISVKRP
jgi:hypothetical protein